MQHPGLLILSVLSLSLSMWSQEQAIADSGQGITDKNYTEAYGAYLLAQAYREHGNWGVKVDTKSQGKKKVFVVEPGPIYHFSELKVTGVKTITSAEVMQDAPKPGEVYSPIRVNEWKASLEKKYPLKVVEARHDLDHAHATVSIHIVFREIEN
jgi:outer membrane protein assembly factor BamA